MNEPRHDVPAGDGSSPTVTIVAVHGNGGGGERFALAVPRMPAGAVLHPVTLPGFAATPADASLRTVADYADHLARLLADVTATTGRPPIVLGHGIGGSIAMDLAARHPQSMTGLVLHAPVAADLDTRLFPRIMSTRPVRRIVRWAISARMLRPVWRRVFFPHGAPTATLDVFFEAYRHCAVFGQMFEIITPEWFAEVHPIDAVPVTLLWGADDRVLKSGQADAVRAKVPNAVTVVREGWDHFPMIEQPEEYAHEIARIAIDLATRRR
jgi:pimeloyl-ACP methyl ester carboxylesterase